MSVTPLRPSVNIQDVYEILGTVPRFSAAVGTFLNDIRNETDWLERPQDHLT
jgi:hypothetical protein